MKGSDELERVALEANRASAPLKIVQITPGTGHFYCGSCLRDELLVRALRARGHDVMMIPVYLPFVLEDDSAEKTEDPVFLGGVNVYLEHRLRWWHWLPRFVRHWLDRPSFLRWAASRGSMTEAKDLGALTVAMLRGESGPQQAGLDELITWLRDHERPDLICLSNALLSGLARRLREAIECPVVGTLQGEAPFLDALPKVHRDQAWSELQRRAGDLDAFVAVSRYTADLMSERLQLPPERVSVIHNGIALEGIPTAARDASPPVIGYLARMCADKGLDRLVAAFVALRASGTEARLQVAGVQLAEDRPFVRQLQEQLRSAGLGSEVTWLPNCTKAEKLRFLGELSVMSVPATYGESFGLYLVEAWAAGVPVVQPRHGSFLELIEATEAGLLCEANDTASLADGLRRVLEDRCLSDRLSAAGQRAAREYFTMERMADEFEAFCRRSVSA